MPSPRGSFETKTIATAGTGSRGRSTVKTHPLFRQVARIDPAVVRFDAPSAEGEAKAQAGSIGAALLERAEQFVDVPTRETAAFVLDLDEHALGAGADPERDGGTGRVNLNAFCSRFPTTAARTCRSASIATPSSTGITVSLMPRAFASKCCGRREFVDESGHQEWLPILDALREPDLGERATDERA